MGQAGSLVRLAFVAIQFTQIKFPNTIKKTESKCPVGMDVIPPVNGTEHSIKDQHFGIRFALGFI